MAVIVFQFLTKRKESETVKHQLTSYEKKIDSLTSELFVSDIKLNRYQMTLEKMREQDSTCSLLFEYMMESETE